MGRSPTFETGSTQERTAVPPDWERGYERWLEDFRARRASAYRRPLRTVVRTMAEGFRK